jgi:hypothetical protein
LQCDALALAFCGVHMVVWSAEALCLLALPPGRLGEMLSFRGMGNWKGTRRLVLEGEDRSPFHVHPMTESKLVVALSVV